MYDRINCFLRKSYHKATHNTSKEVKVMLSSKTNQNLSKLTKKNTNLKISEALNYYVHQIYVQ